MRRRNGRPSRAGITLTECLIAIMIMGVGLISLATLFPLGLMRLRDASRNTRSAFLFESATEDVEARGLLNRSRFTATHWYSRAYNGNTYDPWLTDPLGPPNGFVGLNLDPNGGYPYPRGLRTFPVAYDPLWRYATPQPAPVGTRRDFPPLPSSSFPSDNEGRFGCGFVSGSATTGFIRPDPDGRGPASAYGLPRVTNFVDNYLPTQLPAGVTYNGLSYGGSYSSNQNLQFESGLVGDIFASPDDVVLQEEGEPGSAAGIGNPLLPDLSSNFQLMNDWSYSWMVTGRQIGTDSTSSVEGDIVVFHNRAFGTVSTPSPFNGTAFEVPVGDRVIEAVFGYGGVVPTPPGYALGADRSVLVRWPASMPDPEIKVGSWIADVTFERLLGVDLARYDGQPPAGPAPSGTYPNQRCHWYQVARRSEPEPATPFAGDPLPYRQMTLTVKTPLRAQTLLNAAGQPVNVNVALFSPYIVNVFPKVFDSH